ncbi:uncharacterized protein An02g12740 [Aspergillus niger]|uniref:Contig An02c0410, genomic contig n=2 Tax=Aspergillus niger TaxID=5061 RepID=A2QEZ4_ASPNC|nr:uncharacterized protein An02g12740 [Aspergillus niger]CAK44544.1 unnamed protein product [Aspergillus niger]
MGEHSYVSKHQVLFCSRSPSVQNPTWIKPHAWRPRDPGANFVAGKTG